MDKIYLVTDILDGELEEDHVVAYRRSEDAVEEISDENNKYVVPCIVKGFEHGFEYEISNTCDYYVPKLNMIRNLISCLYDLEGCCTGGLCHIVTDDNNITDSDLKFVIAECDKDPERLEAPLCKLICEEMLKLSIQQRALLFSSYYTDILCDHNCEVCEIEKGKIIE